MIIEGNKITADEGKYLYNGEVCSTLVYLGKNASADDWVEVDHWVDPPEEVTTEKIAEALEAIL